MRRKEFEVKEKSLIEEVFRTADIGYLAFHGLDGWPRITPVNFVYDGRILWHGAIAGERRDCLQKNPRATFSAVSLMGFLPSYLLSEENATAATFTFKAAQARGRCRLIEDPEEKCSVLNQLMAKYQPEGKFRAISPEEPLYRKVLQATGVYALAVESLSGKFKFAQNKSEADRQAIAARLKERGSPTDLMIAEEILKTLDFAK
jgi:nitroimidazol reductase NimA-like FMN-containing flavoprotein (pyridoxamine 5'-phosphate oxidase superfamily)